MEEGGLPALIVVMASAAIVIGITVAMAVITWAFIFFSIFVAIVCIFVSPFWFGLAFRFLYPTSTIIHILGAKSIPNMVF